MPTLLLIAIPVVVIILFVGIMNLPDEEVKSEAPLEDTKPTVVRKATKKKSKAKTRRR